MINACLTWLSSARLPETLAGHRSHATYKWVVCHVNGCVTWLSCVPCEWVCDMTFIDASCGNLGRSSKSCYVLMSHVTCKWVWEMTPIDAACLPKPRQPPPKPWQVIRVISCVNELCHKWLSRVKIRLVRVTYEWVMPHVNGSCHVWMSPGTYEWVMSHRNESCHIWMRHVTYEWVISHVNGSCHTRMSHVIYEWVCHIWISHATCEWVVSHMDKSFHMWTILVT